jgi:uncharacterized protein (DUF952 family)
MAIPDKADAYHLVPVESWDSAPTDEPFHAASLEDEGFVHLTHDWQDLIDVGNRYYREDPRAYVVLGILLPRLTSPWRYDGDPRYPHIYGPINRSAITGVDPMLRAADGTFLRFEPRPNG